MPQVGPKAKGSTRNMHNQLNSMMLNVVIRLHGRKHALALMVKPISQSNIAILYFVAGWSNSHKATRIRKTTLIEKRPFQSNYPVGWVHFSPPSNVGIGRDADS